MVIKASSSGSTNVGQVKTATTRDTDSVSVIANELKAFLRDLADASNRDIETIITSIVMEKLYPAMATIMGGAGAGAGGGAGASGAGEQGEHGDEKANERDSLAKKKQEAYNQSLVRGVESMEKWIKEVPTVFKAFSDTTVDVTNRMAFFYSSEITDFYRRFVSFKVEVITGQYALKYFSNLLKESSEAAKSGIGNILTAVQQNLEWWTLSFKKTMEAVQNGGAAFFYYHGNLRSFARELVQARTGLQRLLPDLLAMYGSDEQAAFLQKTYVQLLQMGRRADLGSIENQKYAASQMAIFQMIAKNTGMTVDELQKASEASMLTLEELVARGTITVEQMLKFKAVETAIHGMQLDSGTEKLIKDVLLKAMQTGNLAVAMEQLGLSQEMIPTGVYDILNRIFTEIRYGNKNLRDPQVLAGLIRDAAKEGTAKGVSSMVSEGPWQLMINSFLNYVDESGKKGVRGWVEGALAWLGQTLDQIPAVKMFVAVVSALAGIKNAFIVHAAAMWAHTAALLKDTFIGKAARWLWFGRGMGANLAVEGAELSTLGKFMTFGGRFFGMLARLTGIFAVFTGLGEIIVSIFKFNDEDQLKEYAGKAKGELSKKIAIFVEKTIPAILSVVGGLLFIIGGPIGMILGGLFLGVGTLLRFKPELTRGFVDFVMGLWDWLGRTWKSVSTFFSNLFEKNTKEITANIGSFLVNPFSALFKMVGEFAEWFFGLGFIGEFFKALKKKLGDAVYHFLGLDEAEQKTMPKTPKKDLLSSDAKRSVVASLVGLPTGDPWTMLLKKIEDLVEINKNQSDHLKQVAKGSKDTADAGHRQARAIEHGNRWGGLAMMGSE